MSERPQVEWLDEDASIPGMFDFSQVYDWVVEVAPEGSTLVELGVFHGRSLIYLAKKAKKAGKGLRVVGVDWGLGIATGYCANAVLENLYIRKLEVPLIFADASVAAQFFPPESCTRTGQSPGSPQSLATALAGHRSTGSKICG